MIVLIKKLHKVKLSDCRQEIIEKLFQADVQDKVIGFLPASNSFLESKKHGSLDRLSGRIDFVTILLPLTPLRLKRCYYISKRNLHCFLCFYLYPSVHIPFYKVMLFLVNNGIIQPMVAK